MQRTMDLAARHPWRVLAGLLLVSALLAIPVRHLSVHISAQGMMLKNDPKRVFYDDAIATFGSDSVTVVYVRDPALFEPQRLEAVRATVRRLEGLPFVERTDSLFSIKNLKTVDEMVHDDPYLARTPRDPRARARVVAEALANPLVASAFLTADATAMAINVYLQNGRHDPDFDVRASRAIDGALGPLQGQVEEVFQVGMPYVREVLTERIFADLATTLPVCGVVLLVAVGLALRRASSALVPLLTAGLSILWTLGFMALVNIPISVTTSIVPLLLVVVGSTADVRLLAEYEHGLAAGLGRGEAISFMGSRMGMAVLLAFLTTYAGFLSIAANDILLLQQFAIAASTGLAFNFVATVLLVPVYLRLLGPRQGACTPSRYSRLGRWLGHEVAGHRRAVVWVTVALVAIAVAFATRIRVNNDVMAYLGPDSEVQRRARVLHEELSGMHTLYVVVDADIEGTFLQVHYLDELRRLQGFLAETGLFDTSFSFADYVALMHRGMGDDPGAPLVLPDEDDIVRGYTIFFHPDDVKQYVASDYKRASILVRHDLASSEALKAAIGRVEEYAATQLDPGLRVRVTGEEVLTGQAADSMATGQAKSLALMLVIILAVIATLFVNLKAGLLALVPNLVPVVLLFGVMGLSGIPLDTVTAMVTAIALGICVDDTMHLMVRYHGALKRDRDELRAMVSTLASEARPVIGTSLALALGFSVLLLSNFQPVIHFGLLSALVMLFALLADLLLTPAFLVATRLVSLWDLLSTEIKDLLHRECGLFCGMRAWELKKLILVSTVRAYAPGATLIAQGSRGQEMFVILSGAVSVQRAAAEGTDRVTHMVGVGEVVGELGFAADVPRTADVVAVEETRVLVMDRTSLARVARYLPTISAKLFANLMDLMGRRFASAMERSGPGQGPPRPEAPPP